MRIGVETIPPQAASGLPLCSSAKRIGPPPTSLTEAASVHLLYILNNPLSGTDPTGYAQAPASCSAVSATEDGAGTCLSGGVEVAYGVKDGRVELASASTMQAISASNGAAARLDPMPSADRPAAHAIGSQAEMRATPFWAGVRMEADAFADKYAPGIAPVVREMNAGTEQSMTDLGEGKVVMAAAGWVLSRIGGRIALRWIDELGEKLSGALSSTSTVKLKDVAAEIRLGGDPIAAERRTIAVGVNDNNELFAGSSNGFNQGMRDAANRLGVRCVSSREGCHAEENLVREVPGLRRVGTDRRSPCGPSEHNCRGLLDSLGIEVEE